MGLMTGGNDDEKHLSNGPQVAVVVAERPPPPNKALSQSPRHPAPPLPASLFPPLQTLGHSSLCLSSPACSSQTQQTDTYQLQPSLFRLSPQPAVPRWPGLQRSPSPQCHSGLGAQPVPAVSPTRSATVAWEPSLFRLSPQPAVPQRPGLQRRTGLGEPFLCLQFCHEFYMKMLPVCLSFFLCGTAFPITQRRDLLAFAAGRVALSCKLENSFELGPFSTQKGR